MLISENNKYVVVERQMKWTLYGPNYVKHKTNSIVGK